jgi:hypothetical protein
MPSRKAQIKANIKKPRYGGPDNGRPTLAGKPQRKPLGIQPAGKQSKFAYLGPFGGSKNHPTFPGNAPHIKRKPKRPAQEAMDKGLYPSGFKAGQGSRNPYPS